MAESCTPGNAPYRGAVAIGESPVYAGAEYLVLEKKSRTRLHTSDQIRFTIPPPALQFRRPAPYARIIMTEPTVTISNLSLAELKNLVEGIVDDRLRTLLGDPDLGAPLGESVRDRLKQSLASTERITGDEVADKLGLRW